MDVPQDGGEGSKVCCILRVNGRLQKLTNFYKWQNYNDCHSLAYALCSVGNALRFIE